MADIGRRVLIQIIPKFVFLLTYCWFATCRTVITGQEHLTHSFKNQPVIISSWHYAIIFLFHHLRQFPAAVMVSTSNDGDYIAELVSIRGLKAVRGSANRRGMRALLELISLVKQGWNGGLVADGSQGPARKAQAGVILLASKTGRPILPVVWSAKRTVAINSWDRTLLPLPFSKVNVEYGEPLFIPPKIDSDQVEEYRIQLEELLNKSYQQVWQICGQESHDGLEKSGRDSDE
ncbi:MAG: lysophospholipid acyltransferase family protein [Desulfobulbaceae bacterium]|nr:lysophospholipid acyltransferase family protein [Desulfobulbaceae bacterium]